LIVLTEWNEFRALNLEQRAQTMRTPRMVDYRNIYERKAVLDAGFVAYEGVGR